MDYYKAPGFIKIYWDIVGDEVWRTMNMAFSTGSIDAHLAETLIVLIPKVDPPLALRNLDQ